MTATTNRSFLSDKPSERTAAWAHFLNETEACIATLRTMIIGEEMGSPRYEALLHAYLVVKADKTNVEEMHRAALAEERRAAL